MKRTVLIFVILIVGFAGAWIVVPSLYKQYTEGTYVPERCCETSPLYKELNLTPEQKEKVTVCERSFFEKKKEICRDLCSRRYRLGKLLAQPNVMSDQVHAQIDLVIAAQGRLERLVADHMLEVRKFLTPEQTERYLQQLEEALCEGRSRCRLCGFEPKRS